MPKIGFIKKPTYQQIQVKLPQDLIEQIDLYLTFYKSDHIKQGKTEEEATITRDMLIPEVIKDYFNSDKDFRKYITNNHGNGTPSHAATRADKSKKGEGK